MNEYFSLYNNLLRKYGPQGWWPLIELHNSDGVNPTRSGSIKGYHPGDYSYPRNDYQRFEICIGAILTQNTNWPNVEKALINLRDAKLLSAEKIASTEIEIIKKCIKPSGYFNQKAKKLKIFAEFYIKLKSKTPIRNQLLNLWGIGPETADSILLYAYKESEFVVDAYTRRLLLKRKWITENAKYDDIKTLFENNLEKNFKTYQEFHALIVENGKH